MQKTGVIYCFRANYLLSQGLDSFQVPEWLSLDTNWQGYRISTLPWIADVARILGLLPYEDTPEDWIAYLESLGFREVQLVCCEDFFQDKLYCF